MADEEEEPDRTDYARGEEGLAFHKAAADREPAWEGAGESAGIKIWRIEHFQVVAVPEETYGKFHEGDSYICLVTTENPETKKLIHNIYFWLGKDSSCDERGTAAYKTVELSDFFHGDAHHHRETQNSGESEEFKSLFVNGFEYLEGGCPSGFRHVVPNGHETMLHYVRKMEGKLTCLRIPLKTEALHKHGYFVLDLDAHIYILAGPKAVVAEKLEAERKAEEVAHERGGHSHITHDIDDAFWTALEGDVPQWATAKGCVVPREDSAAPPEAPQAAVSTLRATGSRLTGYGTEAEEAAKQAAKAPAAAPVAQEPAKDPEPDRSGGLFSLEELKDGCPPGVPPTEKEKHLSDADFKEAFGMSKEEFAKTPKWKQSAAKKKQGLF